MSVYLGLYKFRTRLHAGSTSGMVKWLGPSQREVIFGTIWILKLMGGGGGGRTVSNLYMCK